MSQALQPAVRPTMYFIGVTTGQSSISKIFPRWVERLQLGDCELRGLDFPLRADPARYRAAIDFIKHDPLSLGALVTTHKLDVFAACADQFEVIEPVSRSLGEISSIFKRGGELHGRSVDPWTSGLALQSFLPSDHWRAGREALILGAGGSGTALAWHLTNSERGADRPRLVHVIDRAPERLAHLQRLQASWPGGARIETYHADDTRIVSEVLHQLPAGSLVVNATGVGKDTPGSPLPDDAQFPERAWVWDFNYRGDLLFLEGARRQKDSRALQIEDGWVYFLLGWTRVIADVFQREIPTSGPLFEELGRLAANARS